MKLINKLTSTQLDVLKEVYNVGMSKAAKQLSVLLHGPIYIANPDIEIVSVDELRARGEKRSIDIMSVVYQRLDSGVNGSAIFVFKRDYTSFLLEPIIGDLPNLSANEIRSCEQEAMLEVGNIVISSCVTVIAKMLSNAIGLTVPNYYEGSLQDFWVGQKELYNNNHKVVLLLSTTLSSEKGDFSGKLMLMLSSKSFAEFELLLKELGSLLK